MDTDLLITCMLSSTLAATVITSIKELVLWILNRRAKVDDDNKEGKETEIIDILREHQKCIETLSNTITDMQKQIALSVENDKIILKDKIRYLVLKYSEYEEITLDEKQAIQHMWHIYHYGLKGNGDLDDYMEMLDEIPVKYTGSHIHCNHQCRREFDE